MQINHARVQGRVLALKNAVLRWVRRIVTRWQRPRTGKWNPRYLAYCRVHRKTPRQMHNYDARRFPGGSMCGYMIWIQGCWSAWREIHGVPDIPLNDDGHAQFDRWLNAETTG